MGSAMYLTILECGGIQMGLIASLKKVIERNVKKNFSDLEKWTSLMRRFDA